MKRRILDFLLGCGLLVTFPLIASAQCDPGPAAGSGINRCYDDGYVYVDISGDASGYTFYWGYQNSSQIQAGSITQIQDGSIIFHSVTSWNGNIIQVLTDTYSLGGISLLPPPPYFGSFSDPGILIEDAPVSRSIVVLTLPVLSIESTATNRMFISWPSPLTGWTLQQNDDLNTTNWTDVLIVPADDGTNKSVTVSQQAGNNFYRLIKP
jgi:hypothetical protein